MTEAVPRISSLTAASIVVFASLFLMSGAASVYASTQLSFGTIQNLSNNPGASTAPVVATVGSNVYVAWEDKSSGGHVQTYFRMSSNNGLSFNQMIQFTGLPGGANAQLDAVQIAAEGQYVFLTWKQGGATALAASSDNGQTFHCGSRSGACIISTGEPSGTDTSQAVAVSGSNGYVTWSDTETSGSQLIQVVVASNGGSTLSSPQAINTGTSATASHAQENEIAAVGQYVYVTWDSVWFAVNNNNGASNAWSTPVQLHAPNCTFFPNGCLSREPMIAASGSNVYVTFPSNNGSTPGSIDAYHTYIAVSNDHGVHWISRGPSTDPDSPPGTNGQLQVNPAHDLSVSLSNTREIQVATNGANVYVTSRGTSSGVKGTQQYIYVSHDSGITFTLPLLLGTMPGNNALSGPENGFGGFAVYGSNVYVQWPHGATSQLYLAASQDSGATWAGAQQVSSSTSGVVTMGDPGGSQGPLLATNSAHVFAVWEDTSTGGGDTYFRAS